VAFSFVQPSSLPWIALAESPGVTVDRAREATAELRTDWGRASRLAVGAGALLLALAGVMVAGGVAPRVRTPVDGAILVGGTATAILGVVILHRLHASGRRLMGALTWWLREPYRSGAVGRTAAGWVTARAVNAEPAVAARITAGALTLLGAVLTGSATGYLLAEGAPGELVVILAVWTVLLGWTGFAVAGGPVRLAAARSEADPLWVRLRRRSS